jgi:hypothetical protein
MSNAILNLRTSNASIISNNNTNFTWTNINLSMLLGTEQLNKYKKFKLSINNILASSSDPSIGVTIDDRFILINIGSGSFQNHNYNSTSGNNSGNSCVLCPFNFNVNNATIASFNDNASIIFNTQNSFIDINLFYTNAKTNTTPSSIIPYPDATFMFSIIGVE